MKTYHFFKVNLAGQGYTLVWAEKPSSIDLSQEDMENSLPLPDTNVSPPGLSYAASLLTETSLVIAVGSYWPQHADEFGRSGLSFWHGILCVLPQFDQRQVAAISNLLIGLTQRYELGYEKLGEVVATLASQERKEDWTGSFVRLTHNLPSHMNDKAEGIVDEFVRCLDQVPDHANLKVSFPHHKQLAIPILVSLMLYRRNVRRVGGGTLARTSPGQFQHVSIAANIPGYALFDASELLHTEKAVWNGPETTRPDRERSSTHNYGKTVTSGNRLKVVIASMAIITLFTLAFLLYLNAGKTVEIQGTVLNANTKHPIGADVHVAGELMHQNASEFSIKMSAGDLPAELEVRAPGYLPWNIVIEPADSRGKLSLTILLTTGTQ